MLRPLPYPAPGDLAFVGYATEHGPATTAAYSLDRLEERAPSLEAMAYFSTYVTTLTGVGDPVRLALAITSSDYFDVLGVKPALGRGFRQDEEGPGRPVGGGDQRPPVARRASSPTPPWWAEARRSTPSPTRSSVSCRRASGAPTTSSREGESRTDVWMPSTADPVAQGPGYWTVRGVARLAHGTPLARVAAGGPQRRRRHPEGIPGRFPRGRLRPRAPAQHVPERPGPTHRLPAQPGRRPRPPGGMRRRGQSRRGPRASRGKRPAPCASPWVPAGAT